MPSTIYDSSLLTKRRQNKTVSESFITRTQNNTVGSAPLLGISGQSIINNVRTGQMSEYKKVEGGCTIISKGCPCEV
jgi:hypothetical protein